MTLHLERLVAEGPTERGGSSALHLVSVFGGDQEIGAIVAAAIDGQLFQIQTHGSELTGGLGEKPILYRASLPIAGRKRPVRHLVILSKTLFETTMGANAQARRTILYDNSPEFVLHRLAVRFGLPVLPEWSGWFHSELVRRGMIEELVGLNCAPIAVRGTKLKMLRILGQGLRRKAIQISQADIDPPLQSA